MKKRRNEFRIHYAMPFYKYTRYLHYHMYRKNYLRNYKTKDKDHPNHIHCMSSEEWKKCINYLNMVLQVSEPNIKIKTFGRTEPSEICYNAFVGWIQNTRFKDYNNAQIYNLLKLF